MMDYMEALNNCRIFSDLTAEELQRELLPFSSLRTLRADALLLSPQERLDELVLVLTGSLQIMHIFSDGSYHLLNTLYAGRLFGIQLICSESRISPYFVRATHECTLLCFPAKLFLQTGFLPEAHRQKILNRLMKLLADETIRRDYRLAILSQNSLRSRVLTYLTMQAAKRKTDSFSIPFSREELADYLCVNRSALSHELSLMQQEGIISFRKNHFALHPTSAAYATWQKFTLPSG